MTTVLVANRGEIACRVIRSARTLGLRTVAVFSDADAGTPHVAMADRAVRIGTAPAAESYLRVDALIGAARATGAELVHPGYGFLSERAAFARAVIDAGMVFVGPSPEAITAMGDKAAALRLVAAAGVPVLPGHRDDHTDDAALLAAGRELGVPLMVKAAAGGGGKGMRLVTDLAELPDALAAARREATAAFGADALLLERALVGPRHVEVQVLADAHGTTLALGERDCSVQRRHQKVVEEAPSPAVDAELRERMQAAAIAAAEAVDYVGAGTVEFLLDDDAAFTFLEMNTRIQVEHPVTELAVRVGGEPLDLVAWQLRIATGERLPWTQDEVGFDGHAIEARLYAEDPAAEYLPQTGTVRRWHVPAGAVAGAAPLPRSDVGSTDAAALDDGAATSGQPPTLRVDAGIAAGSTVGAHYDAMLAKVVAHGRDRDEARRRLAAALDDTVLLGVTTNRAFLAGVLRDERFAAGDATTAFLDDGLERALPGDVDVADLALVAAWWHRHRAECHTTPAELQGWSNAPWLAARQVLRSRRRDGTELVVDVAVHTTGDGALHVDATPLRLEPDDSGSAGGTDRPDDRASTLTGVSLRVDDRGNVTAHGDDDPGHGGAVTGRPLGRLDDLDGVELAPHRLLVHLPRIDLDVTDLVLSPPRIDDAAGTGTLLAPMHGVVTAVRPSVGDRVEAGDVVVVVEAMKMEHAVRADVAGRLSQVVAVDTQVTPSTVLARVEAAEERG